MKENGSIIRLVEKASFTTLMETLMTGSGPITKLTGTAFTLTAKALDMKETGGTTSKMAKDSKLGLKDHSMKATT